MDCRNDSIAILHFLSGQNKRCGSTDSGLGELPGRMSDSIRRISTRQLCQCKKWLKLPEPETQHVQESGRQYMLPDLRFGHRVCLSSSCNVALKTKACPLPSPLPENPVEQFSHIMGNDVQVSTGDLAPEVSPVPLMHCTVVCEMERKSDTSRNMVFAAITNPERRRILEMLRNGRRPVGELVAAFPGLPQSAISRHLCVLREAGLVSMTPLAQQRLYSLRPQKLRVVDDWISMYREFWSERMVSLKMHLERHESDGSQRKRK